jgi:hypothetical protein
MSDKPSTDNAGCLKPGLGVILTFMGLAAILVGRFIIGFLFLGSGIYMLYSYQKSREEGGK